jgi:hypothetical protein
MLHPIRDSLIIAALVAATACTAGGPTDSELAAEDETGVTEVATTAVESRRPPVIYHDDGSVETGGEWFANVVEFQHSANFMVNDRRCATREPSRLLRGAPTDCTTSATVIKPEYSPDSGPVFTIPVVFHIVKKTDGTGEIPDALIQSQIAILNEDYGAIAGTLGEHGTVAKIRFVLASQDPNGQPTTGIVRVTNNTYFDNGTGMHMALHWDTKRYLNIYTSSADGALGYATLASESAGAIDDGVVLLHSTVGRDPPMGGEYNKGRTGTHEVGHYLGLLHTFDSGCGTASAPYTTADLIKDTVAHRDANYQCTAATSTCTGGGVVPIDNYMNYTPDTCMTKFTPEQVNRMRCSIMNYRQELVMSGAVGVPPIAKFSWTVDGLSARFVDESTDADGTVMTRSWLFGDGAASADQNPTHAYATAGTYAVTLEVTDNSGATHTYSANVAVDEPTACKPGDDDCACTGDDCDDTSGGGCCETGGSSLGGSATLMIAVLLGLRARRRRPATRVV